MDTCLTREDRFVYNSNGSIRSFHKYFHLYLSNVTNEQMNKESSLSASKIRQSRMVKRYCTCDSALWKHPFAVEACVQ